jgi:hypothetical protein
MGDPGETSGGDGAKHMLQLFSSRSLFSPFSSLRGVVPGCNVDNCNSCLQYTPTIATALQTQGMGEKASEESMELRFDWTGGKGTRVGWELAVRSEP